MKRFSTYSLAFLLALSCCPVFAYAGQLAPAATSRAQGGLSMQDYAVEAPLLDGTYVFDSFTSDTGMVDPNSDDSPARAIVVGDTVVLVLDVYNPDKYDGLWFGKRSDAPADPYSADVTTASMMLAGDYAGNTSLWIDEDGLVGDKGATYKACRFVMQLTVDEFSAFMSDEGHVPYVVRRSVWSPSNPGKWMGSGDHFFTLSGMQWESASTDVPGEGAYANGTYVFDSFVSDTGMVIPNNADGPATAVINDGNVALILDVYNPDKYDGLWAGKRSAAPSDPYDSTVVNATMMPAGDYSGGTNLWTDADGLVGEAGEVYKASRFVIFMEKDAFIAMVENDSDEDFYYAIRRAPWSPSNPGKWMGSGDHYFTFGNLLKKSRSVYVPGGFPSGGDVESAVTHVKRLIDALPYDPYKVVPGDAEAIGEAEEAYGKLTALEQLQLDNQEAGNGVLTYGRTLECASWGLRALAPVDDTTTLADGTYTSQVVSTCEMGKSNSKRGYKFAVAKVVVKDGHATATLEHETASPDTVSIGGTVYAHVNADEKEHSRFEVPIDLNSTFYLSQMAKNPTANTIAIPYEMTTTVDEANAVPDPPEVASPAAASTAKNKKAGADARSGKASSAAASSRIVTITRPRAAAVEEEAPVVREIVRKRQSQSAEVPADSDSVEAAPDVAPYAAAGAGTLALLGVVAFALDYVRRDRQPVRVRGVRLSGKRV